MYRQVFICAVPTFAVLVLLYHVIQGRRIPIPPKAEKRSCWLGYLAYLGVIGSFAGLAGTGLYSALVLNDRMTGLFLMAHASIGSVFLGSLTVLAFLWAEACRFTANDCHRCTPEPAPSRFQGRQKLCFWALLVCGIVSATTMIFSMLPLFSAPGMAFLYRIHRISAFVLVLTAVFHVYLLLLARRPKKA